MRSPNPGPSLWSRPEPVKQPRLDRTRTAGTTRPPHPPHPAARGSRRNAAREARPKPEPGTSPSQAGHRPHHPLNQQATTGTGGLPAGTSHGGRAAPSPQATRRRSALDASRTAPGQSGAGSGGTPPRQAPDTASRRETPGQGTAPQSGQSQFTLQGESDISAHTWIGQCPDSDCRRIRITRLTSLYGH